MASHKIKSIDERLADVRSLLANARRVRGATQTAVGDALGVSASQYSRIENGSSDMTLKQFLIACDDVGLDPAEVFGAPQSVSVTALKEKINAYESKLSAIERALQGRKDAWDK